MNGRNLKTTLRSLVLVPALVAVSAGTLSESRAWAWAGLGHSLVARTAALLLQEDDPAGWGDLIGRYRFELGFYSMVPDAIFRLKDGKDGKLESPTHFFNIDAFIPRVEDPSALAELARVPVRYADAKRYFEAGTGSGKTALDFSKLGSNPWRVEQFQQLAMGALKGIKQVEGGYKSGTRAQGDLKRIFDGLLYLGLLSHYSGDALVPYHATVDFNGAGKGDRGIHFYFEGDCVAALSPELDVDVLKAARANRAKWLSQWGFTHDGATDPTPLAMMKILLDSARQLPELTRIDLAHVVLHKSTGEEQLAHPAERKPPAVGCRFLKPLLVAQLAKASVLTVYLWKQVLPPETKFATAPPLEFSDIVGAPAYVEPDYDEPGFAPGSGVK